MTEDKKQGTSAFQADDDSRSHTGGVVSERAAFLMRLRTEA